MADLVAALCNWPASPVDRPWPRESVHVWCGVFRGVQNCDVMAEVLSDDERARAGRFHFPRDRRWFIARRYMIRSILARYLQIPPADLRFTRGTHGKPGICTRADAPDLNFSLSHSNGVALCAVSCARQVGIDLEFVRPVTMMEPIVERIASMEELAAFRALPEPARARAFFELWTRKEACVKAAGVGLSAPLDAFTVLFGPDRPRVVQVPFAASGAPDRWSLRPLTPAPMFEAALCVDRPDPEVVCWRFGPPVPVRSDAPVLATNDD